MKRLSQLMLSSLLSCTFMCSTISSFAAETSANAPQSTFLKAHVALFGVLSDEIQSKFGFKCAANEYEDVLVTEVAKGTAASDCGMLGGDRILDARLEGDALNIEIERKGQILKARLRDLRTPPKLVAQVPKMDNTPRKPFTLNAEQVVEQDNKLVPEQGAKMDRLPRPEKLDANHFALQADKNFRMLADYNVELIVDRSNSMKKPDCPDGLSRWQWCGQQSAELARSLAPYVPNGLTIIPFATEYNVFEHATAQNIDYLFNNIGLQLGTRLYEPLTERLDTYFAHHKPTTKPLLIVVVTDGVPFPKFEPELVKNELVAASQKMTSPQEVTVIFCQIGAQDRFGQRYLADLDQNLTSYGARYHFVHTISFDDLQVMGLGPALIASIKEHAPAAVPPLKAKPKVPAPINRSRIGWRAHEDHS